MECEEQDSSVLSLGLATMQRADAEKVRLALAPFAGVCWWCLRESELLEDPAVRGHHPDDCLMRDYPDMDDREQRKPRKGNRSGDSSASSQTVRTEEEQAEYRAESKKMSTVECCGRYKQYIEA